MDWNKVMIKPPEGFYKAGGEPEGTTLWPFRETIVSTDDILRVTPVEGSGSYLQTVATVKSFLANVVTALELGFTVHLEDIGTFTPSVVAEYEKNGSKAHPKQRNRGHVTFKPTPVLRRLLHQQYMVLKLAAECAERHKLL